MLLPAVQLDGVYRFALLPQLLMLAVAAFSCSTYALANGLRRRLASFFLPAAAFLALFSLSVLQAQDPAASLIPLVTLSGYGLLALSLDHCLTEDRLQQVLKGMSLVGAALAAAGLLEFLGWGRSLFLTAAPPSASFGHRNLAGAHMAALLPVTFWLRSRSARSGGRGGWDIALGLQVAFLLATRSRAGMVAAAAGLMAMGLVGYLQGRPKRSRAPLGGLRILSLMIGVTCVLVAIWGPKDTAPESGQAVWDGKRQFDDALRSAFEAGGDKGRFQLWQRTLEMFQDQPIIGVGAGNWRVAYPAYADGELIDSVVMPRRPHNELMRFASEAGLGAAAAGLLVLFSSSGVAGGLRPSPTAQLPGCRRH